MSDNSMNKGGISVDTEHLFPIIKKWLYSEKEIFLREIVSNACDAVTKLKRLASLGETEPIEDAFKVTVKFDKDESTLTVSDNGIGMNEDEMRRYICQIALSGALDFIEKYEGDSNESNGIIGHFGLGFYSAFMVSERVDVVTKSYDGSKTVHWSCTEDGDYEFSDGEERSERGTDVIMHIADEEKEYLDENKLRSILNKYCAFVPVEIFLEGTDAEKDKDGNEIPPKPINETSPLWQKNPSDCTDDEYKEFYTKVFNDFREPLFHIHINADYPLNFKGILYFPKINTNTDALEGQIKLYYNQVFVSDSIKELLPDYLLLLRGVIDCPELPLNVSRSYMQNSAYAKRMAQHISKKVADKINSLFNTDRENYEKMWKDIKLFVEFACMRERKFYDRVKDSVITQLSSGDFITLKALVDEAKEKQDKTVYYTDSQETKSSYVKMFTDAGIKVALLDSFMDSQFINLVETDMDVKFKRVDADVASALKADGEMYENKDLEELFKKVVLGNTTVKFESLRDENTPAIITTDEQSRRMNDMMKLYSLSGNTGADIPVDSTLILNSSCSLVRRLAEKPDESVARMIYSLALLALRPLKSEELGGFLSDSYDLIKKVLD
ncbi:MAG: molecular chaperone HtpG [Clostridia bacterium]|nr:molecular chaperone HtpG [Clostridia bacterium]